MENTPVTDCSEIQTLCDIAMIPQVAFFIVSLSGRILLSDFAVYMLSLFLNVQFVLFPTRLCLRLRRKLCDGALCHKMGIILRCECMDVPNE